MKLTDGSAAPSMTTWSVLVPATPDATLAENVNLALTATFTVYASNSPGWIQPTLWPPSALTWMSTSSAL